jgi:hypothetical protein
VNRHHENYKIYWQISILMDMNKPKFLFLEVPLTQKLLSKSSAKIKLKKTLKFTEIERAR